MLPNPRKRENHAEFFSSGLRSFTIALLLLAILHIMALTLGGAGEAATTSPVVRVGSELDFPPYAFVDESGQPAGFSVDLIKAVTSAMGLPIQISTGPWDTIWNDLVAGRLDVLPIVAKSPGRQGLVDFSLPHTETYDAFFVRQGTPVIPNIEAAKDKEIVVMHSDAAHHELLARNFAGRLILVDTIPEGLSLIASGKHDAFLGSKLIGTLVIAKKGISGLSAGAPIPDYKRIFSFAVKKGDTELLEKLNQGLLIVKTNGEYDRIYDKWLTADDPWRKWRKYLRPAIATVITLAVIAGFWVVMLQLLVKKRTRELRLAQEGLEAKVEQRTTELAQANIALHAENRERQEAEARVIRQNAILAGVGKIFKEALTCETEEKLGETCLAVAETLTGSKFGFIGEINQAGNLDDIAISYLGWEACKLPGTEELALPKNLHVRGIYGVCLREGRSEVTNDPNRHPDRVGIPEGHPSIKAFLGVPLKRGGKTIGMIGLGNKEGGYTDADREAVEALAPAVVEAFLRKRAEEALRRLNEELEQRVEARTEELLETVAQLEEEMSDRLLAEQKLATLNEELEQRVKERTTELEFANRELESFSYSVSHDLKTPIRAIQGFSRMLLAEHAAQLDDEGHRLLKVITDNTKLMNALVDDLLALSRLGLKEIRKGIVDLSSMAQQVFGRLRDQSPERDLQLHLSDLPLALGDQSLLYLVMENLLANAVKFTKPRRSAVIEVGGKDEKNEAIYYVKDNGVGFDERYAGKLFGVFQRLHKRDEYEGTGVGLAIVKRIVERHGGRVWAEGKVGEGTTFYFALPKDST